MWRYYVYHINEPEMGKFVISSKRLTAKGAKDQAMNNGLFSLSDRRFLRVKRKR